MPGIILSFFGKYSSLVGAASYYSDPFDVTGQKTVDVETLLVAATGTPTVTATLEQSSDLLTWTVADGPGTLTAGTVDTRTKSSPARYVRTKIQISGGSSPVVTLWCKGIARDS